MAGKWTMALVLGIAVALVGCPPKGEKEKTEPGKVEVGKADTKDVVKPKPEPPKPKPEPPKPKPEPPKPKPEPPKPEPPKPKPEPPKPKPEPPKPKPEPPKPEPPKPKPEPPKPKPEPPKPEPPKPKPEPPKPKPEPPKPEPPKPKPEPPKPPAPIEIKATLKALEGGFVTADISSGFNSDAFGEEAKRDDADLDEWKQSFPAEAMPKAGPFKPEGVKTVFLFPANEQGKPNNMKCAGQTVVLSGKAKALHLLVTATDGNQQDKVTILYADAKVDKDLKVTDWCQEAAFGEKAGVASTHRVGVDSGGQGILAKEEKKCSIWVVAIPLEAERELKGIKLPQNELVHVFAITLAK